MSEVRKGTSRNTENENKRRKIFNKVLNKKPKRKIKINKQKGNKQTKINKKKLKKNFSPQKRLKHERQNITLH